MQQDRGMLLESIATTVADYRHGEIAPITPEHVDRWVQQFDEADQSTILSEMDRLLHAYYVSRDRAKRILSALLEHEGIFGQNPPSAFPNVRFIRRQRKGTSQDELLQLLDEVMLAKYGTSTDSCGVSPSTYVYLDDCIYTGNTVRYDLAEWLSEDVQQSRLFLDSFAVYQAGIEYVRDKLLPFAQQHRVTIRFVKAITFQNDRYGRGDFDCFWPVEIRENSDGQRYLSQISARRGTAISASRLVRPAGRGESSAFPSPESRAIIERAFLNAGARIHGYSQNPQRSMRPLGYESLDTLGFGATFVTYRNISNNCPLVLWWGDPSFPSWHPISRWFPLFPRRSNEASRRQAQEPSDEGPQNVWPDREE